MAKTGFENLRVYQLAEEIGDLVWKTVIKWHRLAQDTTGKQLINSVDSIGAKVLTLGQSARNQLSRKICDYLDQNESVRPKAVQRTTDNRPRTSKW